jgi:hypothetical protein
VRDVAAHTIAHLGQGSAELAVNMVRARLHIDELNARGLRAHAGLAPTDITDLMCRGVEPSGAGALFGDRVALIECLIHQQGIRRPLGHPRTIPEETLRAALEFARVSPVMRCPPNLR